MVDVPALREWLARPHKALIAAVADGVHAHAAALRTRGVDFYGYALLPGEPYDIHSLVAVTNGDGDIKVPRNDDQYRYYRYSVDEWAHWHHDVFAAANALLEEANKRFASMHSKIGGDFQMDEFEVAHTNALLDALVQGLHAAKCSGAFGDAEPFLVVWISDSGHAIMVESVRRLNPSEAADEFVQEFG